MGTKDTGYERTRRASLPSQLLKLLGLIENPMACAGEIENLDESRDPRSRHLGQFL